MFVAPLLLLNLAGGAGPPPVPSFTSGASNSEWRAMTCEETWMLRTTCSISNPDDTLYRLVIERDESSSGEGSWVTVDSDYGMASNRSYDWDSMQQGDGTSTGAGGPIFQRFRWRIVRRSDSAVMETITSQRESKEWGICV